MRYLFIPSKAEKSNATAGEAVDPDPWVLRAPCQDDGYAIHQLIAACPPLDLNSVYAYLLLSEHFSGTCVVAEREDSIDGFISAYRLPQKPNTLFVWQVAVHERARGCALGRRMLQYLLEHALDLRFLETTVSPDNQASRRMFEAVAQHYSVPLQESEFFEESAFGAQEHPSEPLLRIGPITHASA